MDMLRRIARERVLERVPTSRNAHRPFGSVYAELEPLATSHPLRFIPHTKASGSLSRCELLVNSKDRIHHALDYRRYPTHLVASRILVPCRRRFDSHYFGDRCDCDNNQARDRSGCVSSNIFRHAISDRNHSRASLYSGATFRAHFWVTVNPGLKPHKR